MNNQLIAAALRQLADAFEDVPEGTAAAANTAAEATQPAAQKRGRGRPVKGEDQAPAPTAQALATSTTAATPAVAESDPFASAPAAPVATLEEVRAALTALKAVSTQDIALAVLKDVSGAANITDLTPDKYGAVVQAAKLKANTYAKAPDPTPEVDPFEVPAAAPAAAAKPLTMEDVRDAVVKATKRTATDTVQKVVMDHGGKATNPETGAPAPSLKAIPEAQYAAVIAAIQALPTTK